MTTKKKVTTKKKTVSKKPAAKKPAAKKVAVQKSTKYNTFFFCLWTVAWSASI